MSGHRGNKNGGSITAVELETVERDAKAMHLRALGLTYDQIAHEMGLPYRQTAHQMVQRGLHRTLQDAGDAARAVEVQRLDMLLTTYMPAAMRGHIKSAEVVLRVQERRAKYLGLDAPVQVDATTRILLLARQMGYDETQALEAAHRIVKETQGRVGELDSAE